MLNKNILKIMAGVLCGLSISCAAYAKTTCNEKTGTAESLKGKKCTNGKDTNYPGTYRSYHIENDTATDATCNGEGTSQDHCELKKDNKSYKRIVYCYTDSDCGGTKSTRATTYLSVYVINDVDCEEKEKDPKPND